MERMLIVMGHPNPDSLSAALADAYAEGAATSAEVQRLDLHALQFDPVLRSTDPEIQPLEPDLLGAQRAIEWADHVAWFMPQWWVGPPALVKGFIDRTFLPGWAYRYRQGAALPDKLLRGRAARLVTTMDSPGWWYTLVMHRALHASLVTGTLKFSGFGPVRSTTFSEVRTSSADERAQWLQQIRAIGQRDARRAGSAPGPNPATAG